MKRKDADVVFGIGFYRREQWPLLLDTAEDRDDLEGTYEEWERNLKKSVSQMLDLGMKPLRVDIDMKELLQWCKALNVKNAGEARAEYIAEQVRQGKGRPIGMFL